MKTTHMLNSQWYIAITSNGTFTGKKNTILCVAGSKTYWTTNDCHARGFIWDGRKCGRTEGFPECPTQLQTNVQRLSWRSSSSAGVIPTAGGLCKVWGHVQIRQLSTSVSPLLIYCRGKNYAQQLPWTKYAKSECIIVIQEGSLKKKKKKNNA